MEPINIYADRLKFVRPFFATVFFIAGPLYIMYNPGPMPLVLKFLILPLSVAVLLIASFLFAYVIAKLITPQPVIEINSQGIVNRSLLMKTGFIDWGNISSILPDPKDISRIKINLYNREQMLRNLTPIEKLGLKLKLIDSSGFYISSYLTSVSTEDLAKILDNYRENFLQQQR